MSAFCSTWPSSKARRCTSTSLGLPSPRLPAQAIQLEDRRLQATAGRTLGRLHVISNDVKTTRLPLLETTLETALTKHDPARAEPTRVESPAKRMASTN